MATTTSRIGVYVPNFVPDNTGRTITQAYLTSTASTGSVTFVPTAQEQYITLSTALTGAMTINIGTTASINGGSMICDSIHIMGVGGTNPYVLTLGTGLNSANATYSIAANKAFIVNGIFNGTNFIGSTIVGS
jgi:hypothetical protein